MRILIADNNQEVLAALRLVLEQRSGMRVAGESRDAVNLLAQVTRCCPDVVLLDADLPGLRLSRLSSRSSLTELVETLHLLCPPIYVIALSSRPNAEKECLQAKVDAFACKSDPPDTLIKILADISGKEKNAKASLAQKENQNDPLDV
jgi:DNA-binding NarL/FixJ family response regulator